MQIEIVILLALVLFAPLFFLTYKQREQIKQLSKYEPILDKEKHIKEKEKEIEILRAEIDLAKNDLEKIKNELQTEEKESEFRAYGLYSPEFDLETSEEYKTKIIDIKEKQREMVEEKKAATCSQKWKIDGDREKGKAMEERHIKLMLRAFNGECESTISAIKWNNIYAMEERIKKAFKSINKMGEINSISITTQYLDLKRLELNLAWEYQMKLYEEKEEQRRIKEQMREEQKAQKEIEKALREAVKEEELLQRAIEKVKKKYDKEKNEEKNILETQILELKEKIKEIEEKNKRALSMAQQTRRGYVYVISNIGSFGEDIYKIGMTRRLEPLDRVRELGDASVPFSFDVHAMIWSEDAPSLERDLHRRFALKQVNKINYRKEFFKASIKEIREEVTKAGIEAKWTMAAEAREYQETQSINRLISENPQAKEAWLNRKISAEDISLWDDGEDEMAAG